MKTKPGSEEAWEHLNLTAPENYIARGVMAYVHKFVAIVEPLLDAGEPITEEMVKSAMTSADDGYSNEMISAGMFILSTHWIHGDALEAWRKEYNKKLHDQMMEKLREQHPGIKFISADSIEEFAAIMQNMTTRPEDRN